MFPRSTIIGIILIGFGVAVGLIFFKSGMYDRIQAYINEYRPDTEKTLKECAYGSHAISCARPMIRNLLKYEEPTDVIQTLAVILPSTACHYMVHIVGQELYKKYGNTEPALAQCSRVCGLACIHGVIGEAFIEEAHIDTSTVDPEHLSSDEIKRVGAQLCSATLSSCHGVGHVLFANYHTFDPAVTECRNISSGSNLTECYLGVFMEFTDELSSSSVFHASSTVPDLVRLPSLCDRPSALERRTCFTYFPWMVAAIVRAHGITETTEQSIDRVQKICDALYTTQGHYACIMGIGTSYFQLVLNEQEAAAHACERFSTLREKSSCVLGMVSMALEYRMPRKVISYCASLADASVREGCYQVIFARLYPNGASTSDANQYCPPADTLCLKGAADTTTDQQEQLEQL
ncbi:MAG: hypothetical protein Q8R25_00150 [bacterium]|nr:hypothetical protein [bacterium]